MPCIEDESVDVIFTDPPYNLGKSVSKLPSYDKSDSIIQQKWEDFSASWDVIQDYWEFCRSYLAMCKRVLKPGGSIFICGSHHSIPVTDIVLKQLGFYVNQWISWCIPNAFPNRELQQMSSSNQVVIWARKSKAKKHYYNVERAKDYAVLDYWRRTGALPLDRDGSLRRVNLRDYWIINNDARAAQQFPFLVHGAKKPPELVARCIDLALPDEGGLVFDPFLGSGTTAYTAKYLNDWTLTPRDTMPTWVGSELFGEYARMCELRLEAEAVALEGGQSLPEKERANISKKAGQWASYILNHTWDDALAIPELVRLWDKPRPQLHRPIMVRNEGG